jgi:hypothetical protein
MTPDTKRFGPVEITFDQDCDDVVDRFSDTHASQHDDIYHNGSSGFGGHADSAETADLRPCTH